jgi:hypothetical protein
MHLIIGKKGEREPAHAIPRLAAGSKKNTYRAIDDA